MKEIYSCGLSQYQLARALVLALLGGKCARCGFSDTRALCLDHVNRDGADSKREGENWFDRAKEILQEGSSRFQLLCANCNQIKEHETLKYKDLTLEVGALKQLLQKLTKT